MRAFFLASFASLAGRAAGTGTNPNCPGHGKVYNALLSYSSSAQFCSTQLDIYPVSLNVSTTSTTTTTVTTTIKSGATVSTASAVTSTNTASTTTTTTVTSTTTTTKSLSRPATTITITVTKTTGAKLAACATNSSSSTTSTISGSKGKVKRDTTSFSKSTPSQLSSFSDSNLSAGCSCLNLTANTVTRTNSFRVTSTYTRSTTTLASTTITTPTSRVTVTKTIVSTITSTATATTSTGSALVFTSTTTTNVVYSTPSNFFIKGSNGLYVSLANLSGGGMYLDLNKTQGADTFMLNSAHQLVVTTANSQYLGYFAVGTPSKMDPQTDWYQLEVNEDGTDDTRQTLCCSITDTSTLVCDYGELFGFCADGALYEGSQDAPEYDYYYDAYDCTAVTLGVVAQ